VLKVHRDPRGRRDPKVRLEHWVHQEKRVRLVNLDLLVILEVLEKRVTKEVKVGMVNLE